MSRVVVVNASTFPGLADDLPAILAACQRQIAEHYAPVFRRLPTEIAAAASLGDVGANDWPCLVADDATVADSLGYHTVDGSGRPALFVETGPILSNGGTTKSGAISVSAVLSHELLETLEDPDAGEWYEDMDGALYAREVCDPVQGDAYDIDGVTVSAFVGPRWFRGGAGPYAFAGAQPLDIQPLTLRPGGYMIKALASGETQVLGERPPWKTAHRRARACKRVGGPQLLTLAKMVAP